jgi:hypothetical protein
MSEPEIHEAASNVADRLCGNILILTPSTFIGGFGFAIPFTIKPADSTPLYAILITLVCVLNLFAISIMTHHSYNGKRLLQQCVGDTEHKKAALLATIKYLNETQATRILAYVSFWISLVIFAVAANVYLAKQLARSTANIALLLTCLVGVVTIGGIAQSERAFHRSKGDYNGGTRVQQMLGVKGADLSTAMKFRIRYVVNSAVLVLNF